jgi:hypothetical protein
LAVGNFLTNWYRLELVVGQSVIITLKQQAKKKAHLAATGTAGTR